MQKNFKYLPLQGICKYAIQEGYCTGCNKLENQDFTGEKWCKNSNIPQDVLKTIYRK